MATVLVTGASRGIGLAASLSLARAGHRVYATMRNPDRAPDLGAAARADSLPITVLPMDVDSDKSVRETFKQVLAQNGFLDALVNNAGIERRGSVEELDLADFKAVMETNYFGAIRCIQAVLPSMRVRGTGCIVNVASVAGRIASSPMGPYTASKFALEAISEVLAQEVKALGIRVAVLEPGIISTDMARAVTQGPHGSVYPHGRRMADLFAASLETPASPELVGELIRQVIESDSWQLRYPVGPDAEPFLNWRRGMTDTEWIDFWALDDEAWYAVVRRDFGLDARSRKQ